MAHNRVIYQSKSFSEKQGSDIIDENEVELVGGGGENKSVEIIGIISVTLNIASSIKYLKKYQSTEALLSKQSCGHLEQITISSQIGRLKNSLKKRYDDHIEPARRKNLTKRLIDMPKI